MSDVAELSITTDGAARNKTRRSGRFKRKGYKVIIPEYLSLRKSQ